MSIEESRDATIASWNAMPILSPHKRTMICVSPSLFHNWNKIIWAKMPLQNGKEAQARARTGKTTQFTNLLREDSEQQEMVAHSVIANANIV